MDYYVFDFETYYDKDIGLRTMGVEEYLEAVGPDIYLVSVAGPDEFLWVGRPEDFNWDLVNHQGFVAHNARFDYAVFLQAQSIGLIPGYITFDDVVCTADLAVYMSGGARDLKGAAVCLLDDKGVSKEYRIVAKGKREQDFKGDTSETIESIAQYTATAEDTEWQIILKAGAQDALTAKRLFDEYFDDWPQMERDASRITREQGIRGVYIDQESLVRQIELCTMVKECCENHLPWLEVWKASRLKTPTAKRFVFAQCKEDGIPLPTTMSKTSEDFIEWMDMYASQFTWIDAIRLWNNAHKALTTFETAAKRIRPDGTMPFGLMYFGAHTGRWSGAQKYNMQNMLKGYSQKEPTEIATIVREELGLPEYDGSEKKKNWHPLASIDARGIHVPRPGHKFVIIDLGQIEPRVSAWLAKDWDFLEACKTIHPYVAGLVARGNWKLEDGDANYIKQHHPKLYATSKMQSIALSYSAGHKKFIVMLALFGQDPYDLIGCDPTDATLKAYDQYLNRMDKMQRSKAYSSEIRAFKETDPNAYRLHAQSWKMVSDWRNDNPKTTSLWGLLDSELKKASVSYREYYRLVISDDTEIEMSSRRSKATVPVGSFATEFKITLPNGRDMRYFNLKDHKDGSVTVQLHPNKKNIRTVTHGGRLTENLTQAVARDVFTYHLTEIAKAGYPALWSVHDELILEVPEEKAQQVYNLGSEIMKTTPPWMPGLVLDCSGGIYDKYCKD